MSLNVLLTVGLDPISNEPHVYCSEYTGQPFNDYWHFGGPNVGATTAPYPCSYNLLKAHGAAVKEYRDLVNNGKIKKGEIAIKNDDSYPLPGDPDSEADQEAAKRHFDFHIGIFSQPIYGDGYFPKSVRDTMPTEFVSALLSRLTKALLISRLARSLPSCRT